MIESEYALSIGTRHVSLEREFIVVRKLGEGGSGIAYKAKSFICVGNFTITIFSSVKEYFIKNCCDWAEDRCTITTIPVKNPIVKDAINTRQQQQTVMPPIINTNENKNSINNQTSKGSQKPNEVLFISNQGNVMGNQKTDKGLFNSNWTYFGHPL